MYYTSIKNPLFLLYNPCIYWIFLKKHILAVAVTGVCSETGWYRINHNGQSLYTLAFNLVDELPELVYINEYPMDEYGNRLDPHADNFDPYHRLGYVWISGFGYLSTEGDAEPIIEEFMGGRDFWDILNDPNSNKVGY